MLSHDHIWSAIDRLASDNSLTASGLARLAGLDPTSFNPSKRFKPDGRPRWPSTESISKVLTATNTSVDIFFSPNGAGTAIIGKQIPDLDLEDAADLQALMPLPDSTILTVAKNGDFHPFYKDGSQLLILPNDPFDIGDRLIVKPNSGGLLLGDVEQVRARSFSLSLLREGGRMRTFTPRGVEWVARILWASQ